MIGHVFKRARSAVHKTECVFRIMVEKQLREYFDNSGKKLMTDIKITEMRNRF